MPKATVGAVLGASAVLAAASSATAKDELGQESAMEQLAQRYPDDIEAKILAALAVSANHDLNDKAFARPLKTAAALEPPFVQNRSIPASRIT